jgi:GT2 family glycosyltransferase
LARPLVGVVVVNFHGDERTLACLERLGQLTWPADRLDVVVVDNGSESGFANRIGEIAPRVQVIRTRANLGFAGGCNVGLRALAQCDYIALLNNDALPEPGWLEPLVETLEQSDAAAATPKVLLTGDFAEVRLRAPTHRAPGDPRELGVQLSGARVNGTDVLNEVQLRSGFWGWEVDDITVGGRFAWTNADASFLVPLGGGGAHSKLEVRLSNGDGQVSVDAELDDTKTPTEVGVQPEWFSLGETAAAHHLVNNTGTLLLSDGSTADRGFLQLDVGQFDESVEVFGWSAAAVLVRQRFFEQVGVFDDRFFLYYEDADLSWRGRLRGWSYRYVPESVVWHEHSATVGQGSALSHHLLARNRLVMLTKNAPAALAGRAVFALVRDLAGAAGRDIVLRAARRRQPLVGHVTNMARVLGGFLRLLPSALVHRRRIRANAKVSDDEVLAWATPSDSGARLQL